MKLGENILKLRKQRGLSQEQLGEQVNVTRQTISNWELDETTPNPEQLKLLSKALNVSVDELIDNDIKGILEIKVSNTEKLAGMIITILKVIGILLLLFVIIIIVSIVIFTGVRTKQNKEFSTSGEMSCSLDDKKYAIAISEDNIFNCNNCNDEMIDILGSLTNTESMADSIQNIEDYFSKNGGTCE